MFSVFKRPTTGGTLSVDRGLQVVSGPRGVHEHIHSITQSLFKTAADDSLPDSQDLHPPC
jgi:hypothetical protein